MPLSTQLLDQHQAEVAKFEQEHYNSSRERRKRSRQKNKQINKEVILQLYRDVLPASIAQRFSLDLNQITEVKSSKPFLSANYDLIYRVDDIFIGIKFRSRKKWLIRTLTSSAISGYVIYCGQFNGFTIQNCHIFPFNRNSLMQALLKIKSSKLGSLKFQDSDTIRDLLRLEIQD